MRSVVLIDDHPIFRSGVHQLLVDSGRYEVVGECESIESCRELLRQNKNARSALFVIDVSLPDGNGYELLPVIEKVGGSCSRCCMLSMHEDLEYAKHAVESGAAGYVVKSDDPHYIVECLDRMSVAESYVSPGVQGSARQLSQLVQLTRNPQRFDSPPSIPSLSELSKRELRVLALVADGSSSQEIADKLFISRRTVENHRAKICRKLGIRGPGGLVAFTIRHRGVLPILGEKTHPI